MKKLITVCVLIIVSLSVFASNDINVTVGGALDFMVGRTSIHAKNSDELSEVDYSSFGMGFNVGFDCDLSKDVMFYLDFSMAFPSEVTIASVITPADVDKSLNTAKAKDSSYKNHSSNTFFRQIASHVGFGHRFSLSNGAFELSAGAGFGFSRIDEGFKLVKVDGSAKPYYYANFRSVTELSIGLYGNARYKFSDKLSAVFTVMPDLGVFTIARHVVYDKLETENYKSQDSVKPVESSGFATSFAVQATIGIAYTF